MLHIQYTTHVYIKKWNKKLRDRDKNLLTTRKFKAKWSNDRFFYTTVLTLYFPAGHPVRYLRFIGIRADGALFLMTIIPQIMFLLMPIAYICAKIYSGYN